MMSKHILAAIVISTIQKSIHILTVIVSINTKSLDKLMAKNKELLIS